MSESNKEENVKREVSFGLVGGDGRMVFLKGALLAQGYDCKSYLLHRDEHSLQGLREHNVVVFPMPCTDKDGKLNCLHFKGVELDEILPYISEKAIIFGGILPTKLCCLKAVDFAQWEDFVLLNAASTAEGAIHIAKEQMNTLFLGSNVLITGGGRIATHLARLLLGFSANVTVATNVAEERRRAEMYGAKAISLSDIDVVLLTADVVFNTVPAVIFHEKELKRLSENSLLIDLASHPSGVDKQAVARLKISYSHELSIPARYSPKAAGEAIGHAILSSEEFRRFLIQLQNQERGRE